MTYELAKELVDAGFPLPRTGGWTRKIEGELERSEAAPNLSELIEACGEVKLTHETDMPHCWCKPKVEAHGENLAILHNDTQSVYSFSLDWYSDGAVWEASMEMTNGHELFKGNGDEPEEAVARLWLALQKK